MGRQTPRTGCAWPGFSSQSAISQSPLGPHPLSPTSSLTSGPPPTSSTQNAPSHHWSYPPLHHPNSTQVRYGTPATRKQRHECYGSSGTVTSSRQERQKILEECQFLLPSHRMGRERSLCFPSVEGKPVSFSRDNIRLPEAPSTPEARPGCSPKRGHSTKQLGSQTCPSPLRNQPSGSVTVPKIPHYSPSGILRLKIKLRWFSSGASSAAYQHQGPGKVIPSVPQFPVL